MVSNLQMRPSLRLSFSHSPSYKGVQTVARLLERLPEDAHSVEINGRVRSVRHLKSRAFASIGDGSSLKPLQAVLSTEQAQQLSTGTAVRLLGSWKTSPNPKAQSHELHVEKMEVLGAVDPIKYTMQKKYQTPEYLRTVPHLRIRTPFNALMLRFRHLCKKQLGVFLHNEGYTDVDTPTLTSSDCEGGGETFIVTTEEAEETKANYFKTTKYLTVSAQLHLEAAAQELQKVWTTSNAFRAEKSDTSRHLSEFKMLEAEVTFVKDAGEVMTVVEDLLRDLVTTLRSTPEVGDMIEGKRSTNHDDHGHEKEEVERPGILQSRWDGMARENWPRITYTEAVTLLQSSSRPFEHEPVWGLGLKAEHEDYIATTVGKGSPVFVTKYPNSIKPFYMLASPSQSEQGATVECFDLLVPDICEIVGGSLREHDYHRLVVNMQEKKMVRQGADLLAEDFGGLHWYVDLRNQGYVPSGGFGLGFDRLIMYLSGVKNIREVVTFPSWVGH